MTGGAGSFQVTFKTAGNQTVTASDPTNGLSSGTLNSISVNSAAATHFSISGPSAATVSLPITANVTALDDFANVASSYAGTVRLTSSDAQAVLPANSVLASGTGGFSVTLKTVGSQTITATDTVTASITGVTSGINVVTNAPTQISVTAPATSLTRQTIQLTLSALDGANNLSVGYSGTVHFTSSDTQAKLPPDSTLAAGTATVSATLETAGTETITATDTAETSLAGSASISVTTAADLTISSSTPPSGTVGARYAPNSVRVCNPICHLVKVYGFGISATGGITPYNWSWAPASGSSLPPGLNVTTCLVTLQPFHIFHCISGTPTQPGTYNVTLTATDSGNPSAQTSTNYTITINNPPPPVVNTTPAPFAGVQNQAYSFTFTASGYPPFTWSESGALPPGLAFDNNTGTLSGTPTQLGSSPITVTATDQFQQSSAAANFTIMINLHGFLPTGSMATARRFHTATRLCDGKVLVAGGEDAGSTPFDSAELYDPATGTFSPTGNMTVTRVAHTATLLANCKVLITGGAADVSEAAVSSAELYDPGTATFAATAGSMTAARAVHTATLLKDGRVLIAGGDGIFFNGLQNPGIQSLASAELFDPNTGKFTATAPMSQARETHTATLLNDERVLIAAGSDGAVGNTNPPATVLGSAELYDPATGKFVAAKNMTTSRSFHTATLLSTGNVLVAGGIANTGAFLATAELFDPVSGNFTATTGPMAAPRFYHDATALNDGTVLLCGGNDGIANALATAEIYDPAAGTFATAPSMLDARIWHTSTLLQNGKVLVTGGAHANNALVATAEVYQ
ncbi:MAG TPA: kelch repeat-containing protein [Candidatus Bathyarchaeia archaeon]|nr:kelch repeat-containing protein [Candidatus Bathyarchaeia archaeon]